MKLHFNFISSTPLTNYKNNLFFFKIQLLLAFYYKFFWFIKIYFRQLGLLSKICLNYCFRSVPLFSNLNMLKIKKIYNKKLKMQGVVNSHSPYSKTLINKFPVLKSPFIYKKAFRHYALIKLYKKMTVMLPYSFYFWCNPQCFLKCELYTPGIMVQYTKQSKLVLL